MYFLSYFQIADVIKIHNFIDPDHEVDTPIIQLSLDGVQESRSSLNSLDIYSIKFNHCRNIFPIRIIRPCQKFKFDEQFELEQVLSDINSNNLTIDCGVFDAMKRSTVLCIKGHSAKFPCQYCESSAVPFFIHTKTSIATDKQYEAQCKTLSQELSQLEDDPDNSEDLINLRERIDNLNEKRENELQKVRKQLTWPSSTMAGKQRTVEGIRQIANAIKDNPDLVKTDPDYCKGIKGASLFLDQPFFNLIFDIPCEYMHLVCLGVGRRMLELTFKVGETRERITKRKLSLPTTFNEMIKLIQVPREWSRRCRNLDLSVMKAAELRNVILFFFPIVLECIPDNYPKEKKVWLHLVFMIRACVISNDEFRNVDEDHVKSACTKFYQLYEQVYGQKNCTYSIHVVGSHLPQIRGNRPLTFKSAFKFESFYSEMKNLFQPGTVSPLKQILQNTYVKRILEHHECEKSTFFSVEKKPIPGKKFNTPKENNHVIYTISENYEIDMYEIEEIIDHEHFRCTIQGKFPFKSSLTPEYNWSSVGVYKIGPISEETRIIKRNEIRGKVLKVNGLLITCPNNVLHEQ